MDTYREAVLRWTRARVPFPLVEERINDMEELSEDQRSALWLYGWSLQPRRMRMAEAEATLDAMAQLRPREPHFTDHTPIRSLRPGARRSASLKTPD